MCFLIICTIHHHVSETQEAFSEHCKIHCLGLLTAYVPFPLAGLWLCNVPCLPRLQLGELDVLLWMKWPSMSSSGENLGRFSWSSILSCMCRVLKTEVIENGDSHCRTERGTEVWCALPLGQLCSFSVQVISAR